jgi:hypothetical protein
MGYWEQGDPVNGKTMFWGDQVADVLGDALDHVVVTFVRDMRRLPTREELRRGLEFSLGGLALPEMEPGEEYTDEQLLKIDAHGYTAYGEDLPYGGRSQGQRDALSEVYNVIRELQEPYRPKLDNLS